jgi:hypothetical protein
VTFAAAADGSRYYAIEQSPTQLNTNPDSALQGIYVSKSGSPFGPWTLVADYHKLAASGSALTDPGYMPGIQAWYNQFLQVDPTNPDHVYAGLEEVFESTKTAAPPGPRPGRTGTSASPAGASTRPSRPATATRPCTPTSTRSRSAATTARATWWSATTAACYRRPVNGGQDDAPGTPPTGPRSTTAPSTCCSTTRSASADRAGVAVSGGLQDNGQSILRPGDRVMGSDFGGDGGDTIVDPANGCNIAEEYVYLAMWVTNNCAVNDGAWVTDPALATSYKVAPPDNGRPARPGSSPRSPRTRATATSGSPAASTSGSDTRATRSAPARVDQPVRPRRRPRRHGRRDLRRQGLRGWCGPCNNQGFTRGIAVGRTDGTGWHQLTLPVDGTVPNRYIAGFDVDPPTRGTWYVAINGFSRKWTEGPGAGVGHVFESRDAGEHWTDISANLPDVPANSAGAELRTAVHRLSSGRGSRTSDTTVPGRTHNRRTTASPGLTVTSVCPAAQLAGEAEEPVADTDGLSPVAPADGAAGVRVDAPADGPAESPPRDGPPTDPPPSDA